MTDAPQRQAQAHAAAGRRMRSNLQVKDPNRPSPERRFDLYAGPFGEPELNRNMLARGSPGSDNTPHVIREKYLELMRKHGVEPAEELIKLARMINEEGEHLLSPEQRIRVWECLLSYQMPKLRALEIHAQVDQSITVVVRKFEEQDPVPPRFKIADVTDVRAIAEGDKAEAVGKEEHATD